MASPAAEPNIVLPGVAEAIRTTKQLIARSVHSLSAEDSGYFGPQSVSWRVFSHPSYGASGVAAVLMQALHPVAMAGVDQHSSFRNDAWRRAHMTADYVFTITFSSRPVAAQAAEKVRRIHRHVNGTDSFTGRAYRADDPDLLLWVHAVHTEYSLRGYERFVRRLAPRDADRFVAEQVAAAELVGLERSAVPATREQLRSCLASFEGLAVTAPASAFVRMLLGARMPLTMRPFWALHVAGAASLLPAGVRKGYDLPRWLPRGRVLQLVAKLAFWSIDLGFLLFRPVRQARAKMRRVRRQQVLAGS